QEIRAECHHLHRHAHGCGETGPGTAHGSGVRTHSTGSAEARAPGCPGRGAVVAAAAAEVPGTGGGFEDRGRPPGAEGAGGNHRSDVPPTVHPWSRPDPTGYRWTGACGADLRGGHAGRYRVRCPHACTVVSQIVYKLNSCGLNEGARLCFLM